MPLVMNQINLQTSFSKLSVLYYLLKVVKDNEPTTRTHTRNVLFPVARSKLKSTTTPWDPNKADTHARITLEEYGLIAYDATNKENFSVSDLGNKLLDSFRLDLNPVEGGLIDPEIVPIIDEDDVTYLIWRILCATHITDCPYDIHPYRVLMSLLSRRRMQGFITKREWANLLANTKYNGDDKLEFIEEGLAGFRHSVATQDIKSTDRVLGRLKDWGVIETIPGTTGDTMAFRIKDSFKWVVYSNLTKKELAMSVKDSDMIKKLFEDWAQMQPSERGGGNITLPGAQHYSYELEKDVSDPLFSGVKYSSLFQVTEVSEFVDTKNTIESVAGFSAYDDSRGHGYFSRAMRLYERFLNDPVARVEVTRVVKITPYLAAIRTKPFILLAGISGTGKSRLVRQLARGCCPRHKEGSTTEDHPLYNEQKPGNFEMIPVRPNWHDSTELMGYVTRISSDNKPKYVLTPFVHFLVKAWLHPDVPFFLCLDEMNLAPVEQYFAEYLSAIESRKKDSSGKINTDVLVRFDVAQIDDDTNKFVKATVDALLKDYKPAAGSPVDAVVTDLERKMIEDKGLRIPPNLVVMGTVNMDETTCTFSRKVLDRAMSFELNDVSDMYDPAKLAGEGDYEFGSIDAEVAKGTLLTGKEAYDSAGGQSVAITDAAGNKRVGEAILAFLETLNEKEMPAKKADGSDGEGNMSLLAKTPFKIAYRSRNEIMVYCIERIAGNIVPLPQALDEALSMKVLSRIEGDSQHVRPEWLQTLSAAIVDGLSKLDGYDADKCVVCKDKLADMVEQAQYGYTSFWMR